MLRSQCAKLQDYFPTQTPKKMGAAPNQPHLLPAASRKLLGILPNGWAVAIRIALDCTNEKCLLDAIIPLGQDGHVEIFPLLHSFLQLKRLCTTEAIQNLMSIRLYSDPLHRTWKRGHVAAIAYAHECERTINSCSGRLAPFSSLPRAIRHSRLAASG